MSISVADYGDHQVFQRLVGGNGNPGGTGRDIDISGTYALEVPTDIQARVVDFITSLPIAGFDWTTIDATPAGGIFSGTLSNVTQGGWYKIEVRSRDGVGGTISVDSGSNKWGIGIIVAPFGQSNITARDTGGINTTANDLSAQCVLGVWSHCTDDWIGLGSPSYYTSWIPDFVNKFLLDISEEFPIGICGYALGGTGMVGGSGSYWGYRNAGDPDDPTTLYGKLLGRTQSEKPEIYLMHQGESDFAQTTLAYTTAVNNLHDWLETDLGYRPILSIVQIRETDDLLIANANAWNIAKAHRDLDNGSDKLLAASTYDLATYDLTHLSRSSQVICGTRVGGTISKAALGTLAIGYRGPRIASATASARGVITCAITYGAGTSLVFDGIGRLSYKNDVSNPCVSLSVNGSPSLVLTVSDKTMIENGYLAYDRIRPSSSPTEGVVYDDNGLPLEREYDWITVTIIQGDIMAITDFYWLGTTSDDPSDANNWSNTDGGAGGYGVPDLTSDIFYTGNGNNNCSLVSNLSCRSLSVIVGYTSIIAAGAYDIDLNGGNFSMNTGGTFSHAGQLIINNAANIVYANSGTITVTTEKHVFNAAGSVQSAKSLTFDSLTINNGVTVVVSSTATTTYSKTSAPLIFGDGGKLTVNTAATNMRFTLKGTGYFISILGAAPSIDGTGSILFNVGANAITCTMPEITYTGSGMFVLWVISGQTGYSVILGGNLVLSGALRMYTLNAGAIGSFSTNGKNITATDFDFGDTAAATTSFDFTGSNITLSGNLNGTLFDGGNTTVTFGNSVWSISGSLTLNASFDLNPGTSVFNILNTSTITSNGKSFYGLIINAATKTITLADTLTIANAGTLWVIAFTAFAGNQYIVFSGSGGIMIGTNVSNRLRTAVAGSIIIWNTGANVWTFPAYTANDWGGTAGNRVQWISSSFGTQFNVAAPAPLVNVSNMRFQDCNNSTGATIYANDGTSQNGGNNINIIFPPGGAGQRNSKSRIAISLGL
jgi:hypothetical protein